MEMTLGEFQEWISIMNAEVKRENEAIKGEDNMAGRIMELAIAIRGKLDGSVSSSMQAAAREASQLRSQIANVNREMRKSQQAASSEQKSLGRVSEASYARIASLQARINAMTERRSQILDAQAAKERASSNFGQAKGKLGSAVAVTAVAAAPVAGMVATAANFEQAMSKVQAITNSSNADMERLTATAQQLGASTQFSASQAAEAMSYLGMAGWKTDQIISGMPGLLDLAAASGEDLASVADIVSDDLTAFGMSADQASHMADVMAATSTNANTNVAMMGETFKYVGFLPVLLATVSKTSLSPRASWRTRASRANRLVHRYAPS